MRFLSAPTVLLELARASRNQQVPPEYEPNAARLRNHSARIQQRHWKCKLKSTNVAAKAAATISQPRIWTDWAVSSYCVPLARARPEAARTGGADATTAKASLGIQRQAVSAPRISLIAPPTNAGWSPATICCGSTGF